jgi:hypothetical protein
LNTCAGRVNYWSFRRSPASPSMNFLTRIDAILKELDNTSFS